MSPTCYVRAMSFVEVNGARLHVRQEGAGDDILLLCGLGDDLTAWDAQTAEFAATHRVTVIDNRGVGQSTLPDGDFGVADLAADAAGVCDALAIGRAHVMGFSMGGAIAQELVLARPDLVRSLVLVGSWCTSDRLLQELVKGIAYTAGTADDARAWLYSFLGLVHSAAVHEDGRIDTFVEAALANPHPQETEAFQRTARAILHHDTADRLAGIDVPTLVVVGEGDMLCPPRHSRAIATRIAGSRLVEVPEQAHQPFQEDPAGFNELVRGFLTTT
jgi:pimeloyl-ACP methyl ester carboxylesterase